MSKPHIVPHLIVRDGARALAFYEKALGARVVASYVDHKMGDRIVHADLTIGDARFSLADEHRELKHEAPPSLGGSPVVLTLEVDDADAAGARLVAAGATVVYSIADQFYGERQGRFKDPFGHLWIVSQHLKDMTPEEIQRGVDAYHD